MARELGASAFGVFVFGLAFVMLVTTLANFGQDGILTREVARDHGLIHRYFTNTLALKLALAVPALGVALAFAWAIGMDEQTRLVIGKQIRRFPTRGIFRPAEASNVGIQTRAGSWFTTIVFHSQ